MTRTTPDYLELRDRLIGRACKLGLARPHAEDLAQDTLLVALTHGQDMDGDDLRRWCFVVLRNRFISFTRSAGFRTTRDGVSVNDDENPLELPVAANQEHVVLLNEAMQKLEELPQRSQRLLRMVILEGASFEEAAAAEHLKMGTLKSALHRAQTDWRERLAHPQRRCLAA